MKKSNNFILCYQNQTNLINFISSEFSEPSVLFYADFFRYIQKYTINDFGNFVRELDTFKTILIDLDTNDWCVYIEPVIEEPTFKKLMEMNPDRVLHQVEYKAVPDPEEDYNMQLKQLSFSKAQSMKKRLDLKWNRKRLF